MPEYIDAANDNVLAIVTIEHPETVRRIDEVMSTGGIDLAFIGPGDLAMSLGIPGSSIIRRSRTRSPRQRPGS